MNYELGRRKYFHRTVLVFCSLLFALLCVEVFARVFGWGEIVEFIPTQDGGYLIRPNQRVHVYGHPVMINSDGLRGREIDKREVKRLRIVFLGDSITYGGGRIREEDLFCRIAERELLEKRTDAEVINLSAPGWAPLDWLDYIRAKGLFNADIVVMVLPECDLVRERYAMEEIGLREKAPPLRIQSIVMKISSLLIPRVPDPLSPEEMKRNAGANVKTIAKILGICEKQGIRFLAVFLPSSPILGYGEYWSGFETLFPDPLDLREELDLEALSMDGWHLNRKGHRFVGEKIFGRISSTVREGIAKTAKR